MLVIRRLLRNETRSVLLDAIVDGRLAPGTHAQEKALAQVLHVSRTPLREALLRLETEGFLVREGSRLVVRPLTPREARELCALVGACEAFGLRQCGLPPTVGLAHFAETLQLSHPPRRLVDLDRRWHRALTKHCTNDELRAQCELLKDRLARYERGYVEAHRVLSPEAHAQKSAVLSALDTGRAPAVAEVLERTWQRRAEPIVRWLGRDG